MFHWNTGTSREEHSSFPLVGTWCNRWGLKLKKKKLFNVTLPPRVQYIDVHILCVKEFHRSCDALSHQTPTIPLPTTPNYCFIVHSWLMGNYWIYFIGNGYLCRSKITSSTHCSLPCTFGQGWRTAGCFNSGITTQYGRTVTHTLFIRQQSIYSSASGACTDWVTDCPFPCHIESLLQGVLCGTAPGKFNMLSRSTDTFLCRSVHFTAAQRAVQIAILQPDSPSSMDTHPHQPSIRAA